MKQSIARAENIFRLAAMESAAFGKRQNAVSSSSSSLHSSKTRGHSTAQTRLRKILDIIAYHRSDFPSTPRFQCSESEADGRKPAVRDYVTGFEIDLNLGLVSAPETPATDDPTASRTGLSSCGGGNSSRGSGEVSAEEKSSEGECAAAEDKEKAGEARGDSEITEGGEESDSNPFISYREDDEEEEESGERKRKYPNRDGCLSLLLEAVRQISGESESNSPPPTKEEPADEDDGKEARSGPKWKSCWMLDFYCEFDDAAPIVRSNRGRNRALPCRLRDSVIEPWKRRR